METERKTMTIEEAIDKADKHVINGMEIVTVHDMDIVHSADHFQNKVDLTRRFSGAAILRFSNCVISSNAVDAVGKVTLLFGDIHVVFDNCKFPRGFIIVAGRGKVEFVKCESKYDMRLTSSGRCIVKQCKFGGLGLFACSKMHLDITHDTEIESWMEIQLCDGIDVRMLDGKIDSIMINESFFNLIKIVPVLKKVHLSNTMGGGMIFCNDITEFWANDCVVANGLVMRGKIASKHISRCVRMFPPEKNLTIYKKCNMCADPSMVYESVIVRLDVPNSAQRVYSEANKLRVSEATVTGIFYVDGTPVPKAVYESRTIYSAFDTKYEYHMGAVQKPTQPFDDTPGKCASGIHGFVTFDEAVAYVF